MDIEKYLRTPLFQSGGKKLLVSLWKKTLLIQEMSSRKRCDITHFKTKTNNLEKSLSEITVKKFPRIS